MGKVMAKLTLTNNLDEADVQRGRLRPKEVRRLEIEALVDTGATMLVLPADVVKTLGLLPAGTRKIKLADGSTRAVPWVTDVRLEVLGRWDVFSAVVMPEGSAALLGQIPLEALDLVVDPKSREVRVNPASPDAPLLDLLGTA